MDVFDGRSALGGVQGYWKVVLLGLQRTTHE